MPLRVTNRIPIIPRSAVPEAGPPGAVLFDLDGINLANNITPPTVPNDLKIRPVIQQQSEWCWAACVEMVLTHYQLHRQQCAIVDEKRSFAPTVNVPAVNGEQVRSCGNEARFALETCHVNDVDDVWGRFNIRATLLGSPVTFQTIKDEIAANRPVEVAISWHGIRGGGHAVLIVGWTTINGRDAVLVNDPLPTSRLGINGQPNGQSGKIVLTELERAFGHGAWGQTWTGIAPEVNDV